MIADKKQPLPNCLMEVDAPAAHETLTRHAWPISYPSSTLHASASIGRISTQNASPTRVDAGFARVRRCAVMPMIVMTLSSSMAPMTPLRTMTQRFSAPPHTVATSTRDPWSCSARTFARTI